MTGGNKPTIGLIANNNCIAYKTLVEIAQVLQQQVSTHLKQIWGLDAFVTAYQSSDDFTVGAWPIIFVKDLAPGQEGYHLLSNGIPAAFVRVSPYASIYASHECLEMIVDPGGNSRVTGPRPGSINGETVQFLVEICDPCVNYINAYPLNGIWVSDFVTPDYYNPGPAANQFSVNKKIIESASLAPFGYLTWYAPSENQWYQRSADGSGRVSESRISVQNIVNLPARNIVDRAARLHQGRKPDRDFQKRTREMEQIHRDERKRYGAHLNSLITSHLEKTINENIS